MQLRGELTSMERMYSYLEANRPTNAEGIQYRYGHNNFTGYNINIDCIVGKWYSGYANYGVLIDYGASVNDYNAVYSSDCGVAERLPKLDITYESLQTNCKMGLTLLETTEAENILM